MSRVRLKEIAEHTGCAISTVSAALNGTGRVGAETVRQIQDTAEKLGFKPNLAARLLKNHEVNIFALVISDNLTRLSGHGAFSEIQERFLAECYAEGIRPQFELDRTTGIPAALTDGIAKGILHSGVIHPRLRTFLEENQELPFVSLEEPWKNSVRTDFVSGIYDAVQYLTATGHRRLALFRGPAEFDVSSQMEQGFLRACRDFGQEIHPEFLRIHSRLAGMEHFADCAAHIHALFSETEKPDAVVSAGQGFSSVALYELARMGLRVPEDVSLIATCANWEAERVYPGLTAVERNSEQVVVQGMALLKQLVRGIQPEIPFRMIPAKLTIRNTVKTRSKNQEI